MDEIVTPEMVKAWQAYSIGGQFKETMSFQTFVNALRQAFYTGWLMRDAQSDTIPIVSL